MSERKRAKVLAGDDYYDELLRLAETSPQNFLQNSRAEVDNQLDELMAALTVANLEDNDVPLFGLLSTRIQRGGNIPTHFPDGSTEKEAGSAIEKLNP